MSFTLNPRFPAFRTSGLALAAKPDLEHLALPGGSRSAGGCLIRTRWRNTYPRHAGVLQISSEGATLGVETTVGSDYRRPALRERFSRRLA